MRVVPKVCNQLEYVVQAPAMPSLYPRVRYDSEILLNALRYLGHKAVHLAFLPRGPHALTGDVLQEGCRDRDTIMTRMTRVALSVPAYG